MLSSPPVSSETISAVTAAPFPPKPPKSPPLPHTRYNSSLHRISTISRRSACVLLSILIAPPTPLFHHPSPASALSFGICIQSFPFVQDQRSGSKSRRRSPSSTSWLPLTLRVTALTLPILYSVTLYLDPIFLCGYSCFPFYCVIGWDPYFCFHGVAKSEPEYEEKDLEEVRNLVKSAARDCVAKERNSFVTFQAKTGVEVCTFRLIIKNAASLLDDKDPIKLEAEAKLAGLIRAFASLSGLASEINIQVVSDRQRMANALMDTLFSLNNFEKGIKDCLEI